MHGRNWDAKNCLSVCRFALVQFRYKSVIICGYVWNETDIWLDWNKRIKGCLFSYKKSARGYNVINVIIFLSQRRHFSKFPLEEQTFSLFHFQSSIMCFVFFTMSRYLWRINVYYVQSVELPQIIKWLYLLDYVRPFYVTKVYYCLAAHKKRF